MKTRRMELEIWPLLQEITWKDAAVGTVCSLFLAAGVFFWLWLLVGVVP